MKCRRVEALLSSYLESLLSEGPSRAVAAHLQECPACRRWQESLVAISADLRGLELLPPPEDLERRIADRWIAARSAAAAGAAGRVPAHAPRRGSLERLQGAVGRSRAASCAAAAVAAFLVAAGLLMRPDHSLPWHSGPGIARTRDAASVRPAPYVPLTSPRQEDHGRLAVQPPTAPAPDSTVPDAGAALRQPPHSMPTPPSATHLGTSDAVRRVMASWIRVNPRQSAAILRTPDDLVYLNNRPAALPRPETASLLSPAASPEHRSRRGDDFVTIPLPRLVAAGPTAEQTAARAAAAYEREAAVVDARLARKVTLAVKATALSDLCAQLRADTGIQLTAGRSVADDKVTVFCRDMPLRDLMRQLSRPFGFTWLRSSTPNAQRLTPNAQGPGTDYRYELVQDLRSQLEEEQLREQDRNAALLALDAEMSQYRPYLSLSPVEARTRAKTAPPEERRRLERYADIGWGPAQMWFRLAPNDLAALRAGQRVTFSMQPFEGEQPLPPELGQGLRESLGDRRLRVDGARFGLADPAAAPPGARPLVDVPEARFKATLEMARGELGQFTLVGGTGVTLSSQPGSGHHLMEQPIAVGISPSVRDPHNAAANAKLAADPALQRRVSLAGVRRQTSGVSQEGSRPALGLGRTGRADALRLTPDASDLVTSADVLEALHQATGMPIVADYYTRLYPLSALSAEPAPLFDALNRLADTMHLRWTKDGQWLQFHSAAYFQDRLKEVPNRLLTRWAASRREHGSLTLDDIIEIAQLTDAQLSAGEMARGARLLYGLAEWDVPRNRNIRPHLRNIAELTSAQQQQAKRAAGLPFRQLTLPQQQQFIVLSLGRRAEQVRSLDALASASLRVDYLPPGWYQWTPPETPETPHWHALLPVPVRERTPEAALQAARRIAPQSDASQIRPTEAVVTVAYTLGPPDGPLGPPVGIRTNGGSTYHTASTPIRP